MAPATDESRCSREPPVRELGFIRSQPTSGALVDLCRAHQLEQIGRTRIPPATVHAGDEIEGERIDIALAGIKDELIRYVRAHDLANYSNLLRPRVRSGA